MKRIAIMAFTMFGMLGLRPALAHNPGANLSWNRDISRVFFARCAACHHQGGTSFSLMTYAEVQPRLVAIKDQVLGRKMPPWGAVKGFGDFRNDPSLTLEEIELVADWIGQDAPKGNNPAMLPPTPKFTPATPYTVAKDSLEITGNVTLHQDLLLDGILPRHIEKSSHARIVALLPDGRLEPLLWLYQYKDDIAHPFLYRIALELPAGTAIQGVPAGSQFTLIPAHGPPVKGH